MLTRRGGGGEEKWGQGHWKCVGEEVRRRSGGCTVTVSCAISKASHDRSVVEDEQIYETTESTQNVPSLFTPTSTHILNCSTEAERRTVV